MILAILILIILAVALLAAVIVVLHTLLGDLRALRAMVEEQSVPLSLHSQVLTRWLDQDRPLLSPPVSPPPR